LEDEVVQPCEEVINSNDTGEPIERSSNTIDNHIDDFICAQKRGWDIGCFVFYGYFIYYIEGIFHIRSVEVFPLECCFSYMDNQDIWQTSDDMIINLFHMVGDGVL